MGANLLIWLAVTIVLLAVCGLALAGLRRADGTLARRRAGLAPRARQLSHEFSGLARQQPANPGEPYTHRLTRAGQGIRQGWERARRVEAEVRRSPLELPLNPPQRLVLIAPVFNELAKRVASWSRLGWWLVETRMAEWELQKARQQVEEIAGLGKEEQTALKRLQHEIKSLSDELSSHRLAAALSSERERLAGLATKVEQTAQRLGNGEPTPAQVAEIHPERMKIEQEIQAIRTAQRERENSHERLRPRLERQRERLAAFEQALAGEEARRPAPMLHEKTTAAEKALEELAAALVRGDFAAIEPGLAAAAARQKELEETLKKLIGLRGRLAEAQEQCGAALMGLRQWMQAYPAPFVLDTALDQVKALQSKLQEQARAASSETTAELEEASKIALEEIRKAQSSFERSLELLERLADTLTAENVAGMQKRAEHLIGRIQLRHASYQEKARLPALGEQLVRLNESWKTISSADLNRQSELSKIEAALQQMASAWSELERGFRRATETLEQATGLQERAYARLADEVFGGLAPLAQSEEAQWGGEARELLDQHKVLLAQAGRGDEEYASLLNAADILQKAAARLWKEYQFRLARTQIETTRLVEALNGCADRLETLVQNKVLDFDERAVVPLNNLRRWLGQAQTPAQTGLERAGALSEQGAQMRMEAETLCRNMEAEVAAGEQDRAWTEDMLVTAEEYQGTARLQQPPNSFNGELASARNLLEMARRKLAALAAPRRKYSLGEYQNELADVRQMIGDARAHVDTALG